MKFLSVLPLTTLVLALPHNWQPENSCKSSPTQDANFDDLQGTPTNANQIPIPYKGLHFQGFDFVSVVKTNTLPGPVPHSGNNYAISSVITQTLQGQASWSAVAYPDSGNKTFSLDSFYYSCILNLANGATAPSTSCNIAITAFKLGFDTAQQIEVGAQTFTYDPTTQLGPQQQAFGKFSSVFQDIAYVIIQYTVADQTEAPAGSDLSLQVDNVKYTICDYDN